MPLDSQPNPFDNFSRVLHRDGIPVTTTILLANVGTAVLSFFFGETLGKFFAQYLWCNPVTVLFHPWTLATYPFAEIIPNNNQLIWWFIFAFFFWMTAGSIERSWGSGQFLKFFMGASIIGGLAISLGTFVTGTLPASADELIGIHGFFLPLLACIVAFCMLRPDETMTFMFVPMRAKYIALVAVAMAFLEFGRNLGFFANIPLLCAFLYVRYGRPWADVGNQTRRSRGDIIDFTAARKKKSNARYLDGSLHRSPLDFAGRWRDHQERKKLERLLRNSGLSDPDERRDERR